MATVFVNSNSDSSLRAAIDASNNRPGADIIRFSPSLKGRTINLTQGELAITDDLLIDGDIDNDGRPDITINAQRKSRIFNVDDGSNSSKKTVTLEGLTVTNGKAPARIFVNPGSEKERRDYYGGGIKSSENLTVLNSVISDNTTPIDTAFTASNGGGIYSRGGDLTIIGSTIKGNEAGRRGGGISISSFFDDENLLTVTNSLIASNVAGAVGGGGIHTQRTSLDASVRAVIENSTITGNVNDAVPGLALGGSALFVYGPTQIRNSTVTRNRGPSAVKVSLRASYLNITSSIIAGNYWNYSQYVDLVGTNREEYSSSSIASGGNNVFGTVGGSTSAFFPANVTPGPGDQFIGTNDPGLAPLANNGGPTLTHALLPGSPALDNGSNPAGLSTDQRGFPRVIGSAPDVGAFEQNSTIVVDTTEDAVDGDFSRGDRSLREALLFIADGGTILFDRRLNGETIRLNEGELVVDKSVTIDGDINSDSVSDITIDAQQESRVFNISDGDRDSLNTVTLSGLTITNGRDDQGAGIRNREQLTLNNSTVTRNVASGIGGGIHSEDSPLKLFSSTVSGNIAANGGGGIWSEGSYLRVSNSTINSNASTRNGGGILRYEGDDGENIAIISNSTLSSNSAANYGGGLFNAGPGLVQLRNSTVTNNKGDRGAGVASFGDKVTRTELVSTIVSGNADGDIEFVRGNTNSIYSDGNNLVGTGNGVKSFFSSLGDLLIGDRSAELQVLNLNGGNTRTHALLPDSPAINAGSNPDGLETDQRGADREVGETDIGAFEVQGPEILELGRNPRFSALRSASASLPVTTDPLTGLDIGLYDADTDKRIADIVSGTTLSASELQDRRLTIAAFTSSDSPFSNEVESVRLDLNNGQVRRVENTEPYALFGDIKQDYFAGGVIPVGTNTLSLELYSQDKGQGELLGSVQIDFSIG